MNKHFFFFSKSWVHTCSCRVYLLCSLNNYLNIKKVEKNLKHMLKSKQPLGFICMVFIQQGKYFESLLFSYTFSYNYYYFILFKYLIFYLNTYIVTTYSKTLYYFLTISCFFIINRPVTMSIELNRITSITLLLI